MAVWRTASGAVGWAFGTGPGAAVVAEEPGAAGAPSASAAPRGAFAPPPSTRHHHDPFIDRERV